MIKVKQMIKGSCMIKTKAAGRSAKGMSDIGCGNIKLGIIAIVQYTIAAIICVRFDKALSLIIFCNSIFSYPMIILFFYL